MPPAPLYFSSTLSLFLQKAAPKVYDFFIVNSEFTFRADHFSFLYSIFRFVLNKYNPTGFRHKCQT